MKKINSTINFMTLAIGSILPIILYRLNLKTSEIVLYTFIVIVIFAIIFFFTKVKSVSGLFQVIESVLEGNFDEVYGEGYSFVMIDIPESLKDLFIDSIRAFENYSKLNGYEVRFSFDNSLKDKLLFKFTVTENPNNISNDEIRADIQDFLNKIQRGEKFDDLPVVINPFEHQMLLTTLKNRINFIEHSYNLEKNMRELYEKAVKDLLTVKNLFTQQPMTVNNNYLQSGGKNNSRKIEADNSNVNMGDGNFIEDNSINIQHSFNEKKTIVEKIEYSIQQIDKEDALNPQQKQDLKRHLENIKEEITEEAKPDASKLKKSWEKIKKVPENVVLSKELTDALEWIGGIFNF